MKIRMSLPIVYLRSELKFFNPYHGWKSSVVNNAELDELINTQYTQQSISELENIISNSESNELSVLLHDHKKRC